MTKIERIAKKAVEIKTNNNEFDVIMNALDILDCNGYMYDVTEDEIEDIKLIMFRIKCGIKTKPLYEYMV